MSAILGMINGEGEKSVDNLPSIGPEITGYITDPETEKCCRETEKEYASQYQRFAGVTRSVTIKLGRGAEWNDEIAEKMREAGLGSLVHDYTLIFLEDPDQRKIWEKGSKNIVVTYASEPTEVELDHFGGCSNPLVRVSREGDTVYCKFYSTCFKYTCPAIRDEIEWGLFMDKLEGTCFYKSGWLNNFPEPQFPFGKTKVRRWFQLRYKALFWYPRRMFGYNWKGDTRPEGEVRNPFEFPGIPDIRKCNLPSLPEIPDLSLPDVDLSMPDVSMPDVSMPDVSKPDLSNPDLYKVPEKKTRPPGKWDLHGYITVPGVNVCRKGKELVISNATVTQFWGVDAWWTGGDVAKHKTFKLECEDEVQAQSWVDSLVLAGAIEAEPCCCPCFLPCLGLFGK